MIRIRNIVIAGLILVVLAGTGYFIYQEGKKEKDFRDGIIKQHVGSSSKRRQKEYREDTVQTPTPVLTDSSGK